MSENLKKDELVCGNTQNSQFSSKHLQCPFGVQSRSTSEARRAEFTDGWMGWDGMDEMGWDGMDGWTEYQKCHLIFFILCGCIDKVYTYLYMR